MARDRQSVHYLIFFSFFNWSCILSNPGIFRRGRILFHFGLSFQVARPSTVAAGGHAEQGAREERPQEPGADRSHGRYSPKCKTKEYREGREAYRQPKVAGTPTEPLAEGAGLGPQSGTESPER